MTGDARQPRAESVQSREGSGLPPEVLPNAYMRPPTTPRVPPRPAHPAPATRDGAMTDAERLAALGLAGPRD